MTRLPGLDAEGRWFLPSDLNMAAQCLAHPADRVAVIDLSGPVRQDVTCGDLAARTVAVMARLAPRVGPGDRVGVFLGQTPWCLAAHLAIWGLGAISVPLFTLFGPSALEVRIRDSGLSLVLTDDAGAQRLSGLADVLRIGAPDEPVADLQTAPLSFAATGPETPAILIYTSGTTGAPKGALHGHKILTGHLPGVFLSHDQLGQSGDVLWTPADWAWIGGLFDVALAGLALGVPVVAARAERFSPDEADRLCREAGVRNVFFPPTALRMLKAADQTIPGLRSVASGGEPLGAEMLDWARGALGVEINEFYGQTECNMVATSCGAAFPARPGCIGKPVTGFDLAVIDETGQRTSGEGDIAIRRGPASMMLGYWNKLEATADKFRGAWMLTGDRGVFEGDFLRFVGREDDVITSAGYRIGPAEIEDCLLTHPDVATVGVVGKPDPLRTEIVKAYVVCKPGRSPSVEDLQRHVRKHLSGHLYPREIAFVETLPMTVTGKVIRKELKARAASETADITEKTEAT